MDQVEEIRGKIDNLFITAKSRSESSSNLGYVLYIDHCIHSMSRISRDITMHIQQFLFH